MNQPPPERPRNLLGIHAFTLVPSWSGEHPRQAAAQAGDAGFDLIEIPLLDPGAIDTAGTATVLAEYGLGVTCSGGLSMDADIASADPETVSRGEAALRDMVDVTRDLGADYVGGILYGALGKHTAPPSPRGRANAVEVLARIADRARASGIGLGLEPVNRYENNVVNTAREALDIIGETGADNLVVHLDTYHMHIEEAEMAAPVRDCGHNLGYVHVGESHRGSQGCGQVDFPAFFRALAEVGYDGVVTFESFSTAVVSADFAATLALWRDSWADSGEVARHALGFVSAELATARRRMEPPRGAGR